MKRYFAIFCMLCIAAAAFAGGGAEGGTSQAAGSSVQLPATMTVGTSASTGTAYPLAVALSELLGKYTDTNLTAQTTSGPNENMRLVASGDADMGFTAIANLLYEAKLGAGSFQGNKIDTLRVVWASAPDAIQIFVREDSGIQTLKDMAGKRIGTGPDGVYVSRLFNYVLEHYGMKDSVTEIKMPYNDAYEAVGDDDMDGMFLQGGWPNAGIMSLAMGTKLRFLELTAEEKTMLKSKDKTLFEQNLGAETYEGMSNEYPSLANPTAFVVHKDMNDDVVYTIVKTVMEHAREYDSHAATVRFIRPENAVKGIPLEDVHPGALRYYREVGIVK